MKLFEEKIRTDRKPAKHNDNSYDFFDRSDSIKGQVIRKVLNEWFDDYPKADKPAFKKRFRKEFSSALYELYIHELFTKQGFLLESHPKIKNSTKRPDFLAKGKGIEFYIEVKEATDKTDAERAIENKTNEVYDIVNKTNSPNFYLGIESLNFKTDKQPSAKKIVRYLEKELPKFNPEIIKYNIEQMGIEEFPQIHFEDDDLILILSIVPKPKERRGVENIRPIGIYPSKGFIGGADESIKSALEKKVNRYGALDKPFLICINSTSHKGTDNYDVMDALFGSSSMSYSTDVNNRNEKLEGTMNGFFKNSSGPKHTNVSAIMINRLILGLVKDGIYWFVKHPFAKNNLDFDKFDFNKILVENNKIVKRKGKTVTEMLKLDRYNLDF